MHWPSEDCQHHVGPLAGPGARELTAVGIEEPYEAIFVPAEDHALDRAAARCAMCHVLLVAAASGTTGVSAIETRGGSRDCVDTGRQGAVIGLLACHADDLFLGPSVVDDDRSVGVGNDEVFAGGREGGDAGGRGRADALDAMDERVVKGYCGGGTGLRRRGEVGAGGDGVGASAATGAAARAGLRGSELRR